jgi:hypothetical protein
MGKAELILPSTSALKYYLADGVVFLLISQFPLTLLSDVWKIP